jgi:hypothetical protein
MRRASNQQEIVRHPQPVGVSGLMLQRKCDCGNHTMGGCDECAKKRSSLQRKGTNGIADSAAPPIVREVLRSPGQPLDATTRGFFEARFGFNLSRVPTSTVPQRSPNSLTIGPANDIYEPGLINCAVPQQDHQYHHVHQAQGHN